MPTETRQAGLWTVGDRLGEGHMGVVYRCSREGDPRPFAMKILQKAHGVLASGGPPTQVRGARHRRLSARDGRGWPRFWGTVTQSRGVIVASRSREQFEKVWEVVREITSELPEDTVLIGGVAVYLHTKSSGRTDLPEEFTQDADMYVGLAGWADLRDLYEVTANRRLSTHQITKGDVEVDVYVERANKLRVDYADLAGAAVTLDGVRVACLEHLLLLKLAALVDRGASAHGAKDRRDVAKLLVLLEPVTPHYGLAQASESDLAELDAVLKSGAFLEIAAGNAHVAAPLRKAGAAYVARLKKALP